MIFYVFFLLLPVESFADGDYEKVLKDFIRMERRLRMVEDFIAEERIQRREDLQRVLNKLSELQHTITGIHKTKQESKKTLDEEQTRSVLTEVKRAFYSEKQLNRRLRRELSDYVVKRFASIETRLENIANEQTQNSDVSRQEIHDQIQAQSENIEKRCSSIDTKLDNILVEQSKSLEVSRRELQDEIQEQSETIVKRFDSIETRLNSLNNGQEKVLGTLKEDTSDILDSFNSMKAQVVEMTLELDSFSMNLGQIRGKISQTEATCEKADEKLEKLQRLGTTTLTTNLASPSDISCLANLIDKTKADFSSCLELKYAGFTKSGVYKIKLKDRYINVYCDQTTDGGGWIVFQRRKDGSEDFYRTWTEYKHGFGDLESEFWLGNDNLADLTEECCNELRVDLGDVDGDTSYAKYNEFEVLGENSLYKLKVGGYSGNAGNSLGAHNNMKFSTRDSDNDNYQEGSCATYYVGAWWFDTCYKVHLNGKYHVDGIIEDGKGRISWNGWKNKAHDENYHSLTFSEMKLR